MYVGKEVGTVLESVVILGRNGDIVGIRFVGLEAGARGGLGKC